jgi:hypothetical protein
MSIERYSLVPFLSLYQKEKKKPEQNERTNCIIKRKTRRQASFSVVFLLFFFLFSSLPLSLFFPRIHSFRTNKRLFFVYREGIQYAHNCRVEVGLLIFCLFAMNEHMYSTLLLFLFLDHDDAKRKHR